MELSSLYSHSSLESCAMWASKSAVHLIARKQEVQRKAYGVLVEKMKPSFAEESSYSIPNFSASAALWHSSLAAISQIFSTALSKLALVEVQAVYAYSLLSSFSAGFLFQERLVTTGEHTSTVSSTSTNFYLWLERVIPPPSLLHLGIFTQPLILLWWQLCRFQLKEWLTRIRRSTSRQLKLVTTV